MEGTDDRIESIIKLINLAAKTGAESTLDTNDGASNSSCGVLRLLSGDKSIRQCEDCCSYVAGFRKSRHSSCMNTWTVKSYSWPRRDGRPFCLICFQSFSTVKQVATHYVDSHNPFDVVKVGYRPEILGRGTQSVAERDRMQKMQFNAFERVRWNVLPPPAYKSLLGSLSLGSFESVLLAPYSVPLPISNKDG